jgi:hypothetical protein
MPALKTIDTPLARALRRAIAFCQGAIDGDYCRNLVKGSTPRELREELEEYRGLLHKIEPRQKGAKG